MTATRNIELAALLALGLACGLTWFTSVPLIGAAATGGVLVVATAFLLTRHRALLISALMLVLVGILALVAGRDYADVAGSMGEPMKAITTGGAVVLSLVSAGGAIIRVRSHERERQSLTAASADDLTAFARAVDRDIAKANLLLHALSLAIGLGAGFALAGFLSYAGASDASIVIANLLVVPFVVLGFRYGVRGLQLALYVACGTILIAALYNTFAG